MVAFSVNAQVYVLQGWSDTAGLIIGRDSSLYYSDWYDTCYAFNSEIDRYDDAFGISSFSHSLDTDAFYPILYKEQYTPQRIKVKGLAAMVGLNQPDGGFGHDIVFKKLEKLPEYLVIGKNRGHGPYPTQIELIDSVRWDEETPYRLWLPKKKNVDMGYLKTYLFKAMLKEPIYIDSTFYIGGTLNSNIEYTGDPYSRAEYLYLPSLYSCVVNRNSYPQCCDSKYGAYSELYRGDTSRNSVLLLPLPNYPESECFGYFYAIVDNHVLEVQSADSTMGQVRGRGLYPDSTYQVIEAVPEFGYLFSHWNDGDTNNPRAVLLDKDTLFVASFVEDPGVGIKEPISNDFVTLQVYPNPAKGKVLIEATNADVQRIEIFTTYGALRKEVLLQGRKEIDISDLTKGAYVLLAHTSHGLVSERLVVE